MASPTVQSKVVHVSSADSTEIKVTLLVDLNTLAFGGSVDIPFDLNDLLKTLPAEAASLLSWLPDIALDGVGFDFDPKAESFAMFATAGTAGSAEPSAEVFLATLPVQSPSSGTSYVVGLRLGSAIDLSSTPIFASMLSGISISDLAITYASDNIPANTVVLPPPAPPNQPAFTKGFALSLTITAGDSQQVFQLSPATQSQSNLPSTRDLVPAAVGDSDGAPPIQWFGVQKQFGPLAIDRIGIITAGDSFGLALDASVATTVLSIVLTGFSLAFPKSDISLSGIQIGLDGLSVAFASGSLQISGSLVKTIVNKITEYNGMLLIQAGPYGIVAVGSFAEIDGAPSLFLFGMAEGEFGGPPAFFVTGLAAGFGYNRGLKLPAPDQVQTFPLVLAATQGSSYLPDPSVGAALGKLDEGGWVPPSLGSYWFAAGVRFTSFELVNSFVLLTVQFGHELIIALLGIAAMQLPKAVDGTPYAYVEMELDAVLAPSEGIFQITALLTPNSFVIDRNCHLTGGFAFYLWFGSNQHAGDFVVTLGGYNPHFTPPEWYPSVPRLGFNWNVSDDLHIQGGVYFAITPSCVMGGGSLGLTYQSGDLKAWFTAYADFIMWWKPFYYDVEIGVSIGASYTLSLLVTHKTITVELSADVSLWGPPLAGVAHVNWWVISFTININGGGSPNPPGNTLKDWGTFATTYLPADSTPNRLISAVSNGDDDSNICQPRAAGGLLQTVKDGDDTIWIISAESFALTTETIIPATEVVVAGPSKPTTRTFTGPDVGVYPLGSITMQSTHQVQIWPWSNGSPCKTPIDLSSWSWTPVTGNVPESLWGLQNTGQPPLAANVLPSIVGSSGTPPPPNLSGTPPVSLANLQYADLPSRYLPLPTTPPINGATTPPTTDPRTVIQNTIMDTTVVATRSAIVAALNSAGVGTELTGGDLSVLEQEVWYTFQAAPMLGPLGSTGPSSMPPGESDAVISPAPAARPALSAGSMVAAPVLRAVFRHYTRRKEPAAAIYRWQQAPCSWGQVHILDAFATRLDRLHAFSLLAGGENGRSQMTLRPGTTLLWDVPRASRLALEGDAHLPLRVTVFDHQYHLLDDALLPAGAMASYALPDRTEQVAITCLAKSRQPEVVGWYGTGLLLQVSPQALLGEGVVVRPQSPVRLRRGRGSRGLGVTTGRAMAQRNWTQGSSGRERGWIETALPAWTQTLVAILRREDVREAQALEATVLSVARQSGAVAAGRHTRLPLRHVLFDGDTAYLFYAAPSSGPDGVSLHAMVQSGAGWQQDGLLGFAADLAAVVANQPGHALTPAAVSAGTYLWGTKVVFR